MSVTGQKGPLNHETSVQRHCRRELVNSDLIVTFSDISETRTHTALKDLSRKSTVSFASFGSDFAKSEQLSSRHPFSLNIHLENGLSFCHATGQVNSS